MRLVLCIVHFWRLCYRGWYFHSILYFCFSLFLLENTEDTEDRETYQGLILPQEQHRFLPALSHADCRSSPHTAAYQ